MPPAGAEFRIALRDLADNEIVILRVRSLAEQIGFCQTDQFMAATAASELGTNMIRYAKGGEFVARAIERGGRKGIEITATDQGPGIDDIDMAMREGYSTLKGSLGMGLPTVKRLADEFEIDSQPGKGVRVCARIWMKHAAHRHTSGLPKPERAG